MSHFKSKGALESKDSRATYGFEIRLPPATKHLANFKSVARDALHPRAVSASSAQHDPAACDRAMARARALRCPIPRFGDVGRLDQVIAAKRFLGVCEWAVAHALVAAFDAHALCGGGRLQLVGVYVFAGGAQ